jgi:hypothetical protein
MKRSHRTPSLLACAPLRDATKPLSYPVRVTSRHGLGRELLHYTAGGQVCILPPAHGLPTNSERLATVAARQQFTELRDIHSYPALRRASLGSGVCTLLVPEFYPGSSKTFLIQPLERRSAVVHQTQ